MLQIKTVLCPTDFSETADRGLDLAVQVCQRFGSRLVLQYNLDSLPPLYLASLEALPVSQLELEKGQEARAEQLLKSVLECLPQSFPADAKVTKGQAHHSILQSAHELPADLIVMGTHGRSGLGHLLIGSTTERVISDATCPVLTARQKGYNQIFPDATHPGATWEILVPIDFSRHVASTLQYASGMAERLPVVLRLLHVVAPISWEDTRGFSHFNVPEFQHARIRDARRRLGSLIPESLESRTEVEVRMGDISEEVVRCAEANRVRMILMGLHPESVLDELLFGPTCYGVLRRSRCPIWIVPSKKTLERSDTDHQAVPLAS